MPTKFAITALMLCLSTVAVAEEERQAVILARAFSYDYALKQRAGDTVVLVVLYKAGNSASESSADSWAKAFRGLEGSKLQGLPFSVVRHAYDSVDRLKSFLSEKGADILLVCEGMEYDLSAIKEVSRAQKLLTVGSKELYLQRGLSLGVFVDGEKHAIMINLSATTQEGVSFSSDLLRLAKVIR